MTEIPIAVEGEDSGDGRYIEPGALILPIGPVPVTMRPEGEEFGQHLVGKALGFRRDEDGVVHATIDLLEGDLPDGVSPAIEISDMVAPGEPGRVTAARLRGVFLTTGRVSWHDRVGRS